MRILDCSYSDQRKPHLAKPVPHCDVALRSGDTPGSGRKKSAVIIGLTVCALFLCLAWSANADPQNAAAILSQVGNTYRHLKSYSFDGEVQATIEVDSSEYRSTYPMELVSPGGPHVGASYHDGTKIKKIAGNGPAEPSLVYPPPPRLGFQFYRFPQGADFAKILGQGSAVANGKRVSCLIVEIHWRATVNNPEMVKGGIEKLWVDKASYLVLKTSFAGFNDVNPTFPHLVEHWVITFHSYKLNGPVPSWYHANEHPFREGEPKFEVAERRHISAPPAIGSVAPDFTLKNVKGKSESLATVRGRPVLIDFWATWCGLCRGEEAVLEKVEKRLPPGSFVIFRITNEEPGLVQSFLVRNHEHFSTLVLGQNVWDRYGVYVLPTLVLVNNAGKVVLYHKTFLGEKALIADLKKVVQQDYAVQLDSLPRPADQVRGALSHDAEAILRRTGNTYRHLKSYWLVGIDQVTFEIDGSKYQRKFHVELASLGSPYPAVSYSGGGKITRIAGNGPSRPGGYPVMPSSLPYFFAGIPKNVDSAKLFKEGSVFTNGKHEPCFRIQIRWAAGTRTRQSMEGGYETLWIDKANNLVQRVSFDKIEQLGSSHSHVPEQWVTTFHSCQVNGALPAWYRNLPAAIAKENRLSEKLYQMTTAHMIGKVAPDFTLKDLKGKSKNLASARGRPALIDFWATWCGPCRGEEAILEKMEKRLPPGTVTIFRITNEKGDWVQTFLAKHHENFPSLVNGQKVSHLYQVPALPTLVVINSTGKIVAYHVGELSESKLMADLKKAD